MWPSAPAQSGFPSATACCDTTRGDVAVRVQDFSRTRRPARLAVVNGSVLVTDGNQIRTLEGTNFSLGGFVLGNRGAEVIGLAGTGDTLWTLSSAPNGSRAMLVGVPPVRKTDLPVRFAPASVAAFDGRVWVEGTVNGSPAVVLIEGTRRPGHSRSRRRPGRLLRLGQSDTVLAVSGGTLLRIDLKK